MIRVINLCGFLCMYDYMNDLTNQVQNFNKMLTLLKYRGPDDFNIASSEHVLFRPLSVINY